VRRLERHAETDDRRHQQRDLDDVGGVVGMPMPRIRAATMVRISARSSVFWAAARTMLVNSMPRPVSVTEPTTMPAQAQASATATVLRAPAISPSAIMRNEMSARVERRRSAVGTTEMMPQSAANCAL
jgi:hypothetical protein